MHLANQLELIATAPHGLKRLRGRILELAVCGKLVPQNSTDEPASELLKRIEAEKVRLVMERYELTVDELERWRLQKGELLIVEGNGSENEIGRCAIWQAQIDPCVYQNHLIRVRPQGRADVNYLQLYLHSTDGIDTMKRLAITTSALYNLSVGKIRGIEVLLPALPRTTPHRRQGRRTNGPVRRPPGRPSASACVRNANR